MRADGDRDDSSSGSKAVLSASIVEGTRRGTCSDRNRSPRFRSEDVRFSLATKKSTIALCLTQESDRFFSRTILVSLNYQ